jgi:hypothetical protein
MKTRRHTLRTKRGSVLIVALIFSLVIAISLASFLRLSTTASRLSYRTYYQGVAMNIAESGLEQAMWEVNNDAGAWTGWTVPSNSATAHRRSFDLGSVEGGATAVVKVYSQAKSGANPAYIIARAIVTPPFGSPIEKWVKVTLDKNSRSSVGGLGKEGIVSKGNNVVMGSWNSNPDKDDATPYIPFSEAVMDDNMALATLALDASIASGNADINGKAAVGGSSLDAIQVGSQGYIGPFGTATGVKDPNSISTNFSSDLEIVPAPTATYTSLGTVAANLTLPRPGDLPDADGIYYYTAAQLSLVNNTLAISPGHNVVLNVPKSVGDTITVGGGSGSIQVGGTLTTNTVTGETTYTASSLKIYTDGDIKVAGQGSANVVTVEDYTPAQPNTATPVTTTIATTTVISNVTNVLGKGLYKNTVIGWNYKKTVTTVTTVGSGSPSTSTNGPTSYQNLIASGGTQPTAGTTTTSSSTTTTSSNATPEIRTTIATQPGPPIALQIFGTRSNEDVETYGTQIFAISGNGNLSAVVYAPNADISAKGGGNSGFMYGSLVGHSLEFTGNDCFYYDESLSDLDEDSRLGIENWDELVSTTDKSATISNASSTTYGSLMNF